LAANWDVDLANELEDYIAEIEKITYSFEGLNNLNFAEGQRGNFFLEKKKKIPTVAFFFFLYSAFSAALLIQGSACVYSRKVEYLYNLVYQTLELVSSKR